MDTNNTTGVDKLAGPLHNSLCNHFLKYYTMCQNDIVANETGKDISESVKRYSDFIDRQEES